MNETNSKGPDRIVYRYIISFLVDKMCGSGNGWSQKPNRTKMIRI